MARINYQKGDKLGNCYYIKDVRNHEYPNSKPKRKALFRCYCGNEFEAMISAVKNYHTKSCGCWNIEVIIERSTKHNLCSHPLYSRWLDIKKRCYNKSSSSYHKYGGRGIKMYSKWVNDAKAFIEYASNLPDYNLELEIDRRDNDEGYFPGNLRWVTRHIQMTNQRVRKNKNGYTGLGLTGAGNYQVTICVNNKVFRLGTYTDKKQAVAVRNQFIIDNGLTEYKLQPYLA